MTSRGSRGWVDPVPDPLLLRKSGSAGDRTRDLCICSQKLWPLDHRPTHYKIHTLKNQHIHIPIYYKIHAYTQKYTLQYPHKHASTLAKINLWQNSHTHTQTTTLYKTNTHTLNYTQLHSTKPTHTHTYTYLYIKNQHIHTHTHYKIHTYTLSQSYLHTYSH